MKKADAIQNELQTIEKENDGILRPEDVVAFAQNPDTALHDKFTWDDSAAAQEYRLWQARQVIRVNVTMIPRAEQETRTYVSLMPDRKIPGGGYRHIESVLSDEQRRRQLEEQAVRALLRERERYGHIKLLSGVWQELDRVQEQMEKKKRTRKNPVAPQPRSYASV